MVGFSNSTETSNFAYIHSEILGLKTENKYVQICFELVFRVKMIVTGTLCIIETVFCFFVHLYVCQLRIYNKNIK